jgi:rare lipoprotein A
MALAGCASGPRGGGNVGGRDGPGANPPPGLAQTPDAEPRVEAIRNTGGTSKPYTVLGRSYVPITDDRPLRESGLASWYGRKFHSQSTASGEPYDMYAMTAAHKTLPLPSYVRVRNPANGREIVVRVNDRGPFHDDRVIDLSYTAALRLDLLRGVAPVEIERITNEDIRTGAWRRGGGTMLATAPAPMSAPVPPSTPVDVPIGMTVRTADSAAVTTPATPQPRMAVTELPPLAGSPAFEVAAPTSARAAKEAQGDPWADDALVNPASPATSPARARAGAAIAGYWVQLGAFRERDGAEGLLAKAAGNLPALAPQLRIFADAGTNRLQAGPFASRDAAQGAVTQVREALGIAPMVVERR